MPAPARVSAQEIVNALLTWHGDVANAARSVGLSRNGLYQRMERLGLDPNKFRNLGHATPAIPMPTVSRVTSMPTNASGAQLPAGAQKNARAIFPSTDVGRRLGAMQQGTAAAVAASEAAVPIKTAPRRLQPIRVKPDQRDLLQRAAWELQARFQAATDENLILEQFIEEEFAEWLASKLNAGEAAKPERKGKR